MTNITSLEALADPTRRKIFEQIRTRPHTVGELVKSAQVSQPAVSQHLSVLKAARLVKVTKAGNQRIYSLDMAGLSELRAYVDSFWDGLLDVYKEKAEQYYLRE